MNRARHVLVRLTALLLPVVVLAGCGSGDDDPEADSTTTPQAQCSYVDDDTDPAKEVDEPPSEPDEDPPAEVTISTNLGDIPVKLDADSAPCAVGSFVSLAEQGFYDDTTCHRLTTQGYFVLQCGDPSGTGNGGPGYRFADELVDNDPRLQPCGEEAGQQFCTYNPGIVAMANSGPDTNGSQFFLVYGASKFAPAYTVLGTMDAAGLKVLTEIAKVGSTATDPTRPGDGPPNQQVTITEVG